MLIINFNADHKTCAVWIYKHKPKNFISNEILKNVLRMKYSMVYYWLKVCFSKLCKDFWSIVFTIKIFSLSNII